MKAHPVIESPKRWITAVLLTAAAVAIQAGLLYGYADAAPAAALTDAVLSVGLFCGLAYLSWYIIGFVSLVQTDVVVSTLALLFWLTGSFAVQNWVEIVQDTEYTPFAVTLPFRALFGILAWTVIMLAYRLEKCRYYRRSEEDDNSRPEEPGNELPEAETVQQPEESMDRIAVKNGSKIHLIAIDELIYIQACGDYVTLVTPEGQYIKELTMKYLETHLPASGFVRVHRSTIVNVTQISRVELYGKENYRLLLKNGDKLRVSLSGYKLLKARLEL